MSTEPKRPIGPLQYLYSDAILIEPGDSLGSIGVVTKSKDFGFDSS